MECIKRLACSSLSAEALALCDDTDNVIFLKHMMLELLPNNNFVKMPINVYTDNQSLFDTVWSTNNVTEKRLRIGIAAAKENIENNNLNTYWVNTNQQLINVLTKQGVCSDLLLKAVCSCVLPVVN